MNPILVSIIIPCYNVENYVGEALDSAINQTYQPIEIIIVDNNSTDGTLKIIKNYKRLYPDLTTVLEEKKQGASAARNRGLSFAKGECVQFLDADDLLMADKIQRQLDLIKSNPSKKMVVGACIYRRIDGSEFNYLPETDDPFKAIMKNRHGNTLTNIYNREAVCVVGGWNENSIGHEDTELILDIIMRFGTECFVYDLIPGSIARMRQSGQITSMNLAVYNHCALLLRIKIRDFLSKRFPDYFSVNQIFFNNFLYYFIYRYGIYHPKDAYTFLSKQLGKDFYPKRIDSSFISTHQKLIVRLFGFLPYMLFRKFLKEKILSLFR